MNILPKKKWHVRTKENVARVRRDEAKAAEEEKRRVERAALAEQEARTQRLRMQAVQRVQSQFDLPPEKPNDIDDSAGTSAQSSGHVNFFADLESEERKNLGNEGNVENKAEKAEEKKAFESKMGILKYLGEGSSEYTKTVPWYQKAPEKHRDLPVKGATKPMAPKKELPTGVLDFGTAQKRLKKHKKEKKKKKHKKHSSSDEEEDEEKKREQLARLRRERLARERAEADRTAKLLQPKKEEKKPAVEQQYNSQFNPDFARQNRPPAGRQQHQRY